MNKRILLTIISIFFIADILYASDLSLQKAINIALLNNKKILIINTSTKAAKYAMESSKGKYLPSLSIEGKYTKLNDDINIDLNPIRTSMISSELATLQTAGVTNPLILTSFKDKLESSLPSFVDEVQKDSFCNLSVTLTQPLYTGGKISANFKAKVSDLLISNEQNLLIQNEVTADVVSSYYRIKLIEKIIKIRQQTVDNLIEHNKQSDALLKEGMIAKTQKLRFEVALSEAQREYYKVIRDIKFAKSIFKYDCGGEVDVSSFNLTSDFVKPKPIESLDYYQNKAINNFNIKILNEKDKQLTYKLDSIKSNFQPSLFIFGKYEIYQEDLTMLEPDLAIGVNAKINIFNGLSDINDIKSTKMEIESLIQYKNKIYDNIKLDIEKSFNDVLSNIEQYNSLQISKDLALENTKLNSISYKEGLATSLDVIDAELSLEKIKIEEENSVYNYNLSLSKLFASCSIANEIINYSEVK